MFIKISIISPHKNFRGLNQSQSLKTNNISNLVACMVADHTYINPRALSRAATFTITPRVLSPHVCCHPTCAVTPRVLSPHVSPHVCCHPTCAVTPRALSPHVHCHPTCIITQPTVNSNPRKPRRPLLHCTPHSRIPGTSGTLYTSLVGCSPPAPGQEVICKVDI